MDEREVNDVTIYLGPPGTGKTTTLLDVVDEALANGIEPERIGYFAFTRKAANEAAKRAMMQFTLSSQELPYFRTLHSLAYGGLGLRRTEVLGDVQLADFGTAHGFKFHAGLDDNGFLRPPAFLTLGDSYLYLYHMSRSKGVPLEVEWQNASLAGVHLHLAQKFAADLEAYKREKGLVDFADMVDMYDPDIELDVLIIDEAQDLTRQQWVLARKLMAQARKVYIGGDDDQAIYEWAGADVDTFLSLEGRRIVLGQTHRLPVAIHAFADDIARRISRRYEKEWRSADEPGLVTTGDYDHLDLSRGTWMLLARHQHQLAPLRQWVERRGYVYEYNHVWSSAAAPVRAVIAYEKLRRGDQVDRGEAALAVEFVPGVLVPQGDAPFAYDQFAWPWEGRPEWLDALSLLSTRWREYIRACRRNGERLVGPGRIVISTIHGVKGGEAENVVLHHDMTDLTYRWYQRAPDTEHRVFYVGASRASRALYIVPHRSLRFYRFRDWTI